MLVPSMKVYLFIEANATFCVARKCLQMELIFGSIYTRHLLNLERGFA
jgi:hypothetical protein